MNNSCAGLRRETMKLEEQRFLFNGWRWSVVFLTRLLSFTWLILTETTEHKHSVSFCFSTNSTRNGSFCCFNWRISKCCSQSRNTPGHPDLRPHPGEPAEAGPGEPRTSWRDDVPQLVWTHLESFQRSWKRTSMIHLVPPRPDSD